MSWETIKSVILCSYCWRKKDGNPQENDETSSLLKNEKNPPFKFFKRPPEKAATELNCNQQNGACPHPSAGIENANFYSSKPAAMPAVPMNFPDAGQSKSTPAILPVNQPTSIPNTSTSNPAGTTRMAKPWPSPLASKGDHIPTPTPPVKAAESVSGNPVVSANSPLWQQVESINPVSDSRPPAKLSY